MPILEDAVHDAGLDRHVELLATTCRNRCDYGPSLNVYPGPIFYNLIDAAAIGDIVSEHLACGRMVAHWLYQPRLEGTRRR